MQPFAQLLEDMAERLHTIIDYDLTEAQDKA